MKRVLAVLSLAAALCAPMPARAADAQCALSVQEDAGALVQINLANANQHVVRLGPMPHEVVVSRNGRTAYVGMFGMRDFNHEIGAAGTTIAVIDLRAGAVSDTWRLPEGLGGPHSVVLRPRMERELFVHAEIGDRMVVYDTRNGEVLRSFATPALMHGFTFSRDGRAVFAFAAANGVYKFDAETGEQLAHADVGSSARGVMLANNAREVLVAAQSEVVFLNVRDLSVARRFPVGGVGQVIYATIDEERDLVFAPAPADNVVVALDSRTGAERARLALGRTPIVAHVGPDGRAYISNVGDRFITRVELETFATSRFGIFERPNGLAFGSCPSAD